MKNSIYKKLFLFSAIAIIGCSPGDETSQYTGGLSGPSKLGPGAGEASRGVINGQTWVFRQGAARTIAGRMGKYYEVQLWNEVFDDPCRVSRGSTLQIKINAETLNGEWSLDGDTFSTWPKVILADLSYILEPMSSMVSPEGAFRLGFDETRNEVRGSLVANFRSEIVGETWARGEFSVPFCGSR